MAKEKKTGEELERLVVERIGGASVKVYADHVYGRHATAYTRPRQASDLQHGQNGPWPNYANNTN